MADDIESEAIELWQWFALSCGLHDAALNSAALPRLKVGAKEYGEASFSKPIRELSQEILDELTDAIVWATFEYSQSVKQGDAKHMDRIVQLTKDVYSCWRMRHAVNEILDRKSGLR